MKTLLSLAVASMLVSAPSLAAEAPRLVPVSGYDGFGFGISGDGCGLGHGGGTGYNGCFIYERGYGRGTRYPGYEAYGPPTIGSRGKPAPERYRNDRDQRGKGYR